MFDEYHRIIKDVMKRGWFFTAIVGDSLRWRCCSESERVGASPSSNGRLPREVCCVLVLCVINKY